MIPDIPLWTSGGLLIGSAVVGSYRYLRVVIRGHRFLSHVIFAFVFVGGVEFIALLSVADEGAALRGSLFLVNCVGIAAMVALYERYR